MTQTPADPDAVRPAAPESSWEDRIGSARAVAAGDRVLVSGTMPMIDGVVGGESPYDQALVAFRRALAALEPFGLGADSVVRTRMYLSHVRDVDDVGRAHRELFGAVRPASTTVVVAGFTDSRVLVEVELEAYRDGRGGTGPSEHPRPEPSGSRSSGAESAASGRPGPEHPHRGDTHA
jgi:enamine deaminase RidA (YjgF/YER057c/UK114 family)